MRCDFFRTKAGSRAEVGLAGERLVRSGYQEAEPRQEMVRTGRRGWEGGRQSQGIFMETRDRKR